MLTKLALLPLFVTSLFAADISGIWVGQAPNRRGEVEDLAFQFKVKGTVVEGKLFGDEFDLALEKGTVVGEKLTFFVTNTNFYSGEKVQTAYTATINGEEMEITRERVPAPVDRKAEAKPKPIRLKRLTT